MKSDRPTRVHILSLLKKNGRMTSKQVGDAIGVTSMGARQHLTAMEKDDLVTSEFVRQKAGRPALYFKLTEKASSYFPQKYSCLAMEVLKGMEDLKGRDLVAKVLEHRRDNMCEEYHSAMGKNGTSGSDLRDKVQKLAVIRDNDGYMTEMEEKDGDMLIVEHNCPIQSIAQEYHEVCQHELELFQDILNTPVERIEHMINGERSCIYKVIKTGRSSGGSGKGGGRKSSSDKRR